MPVTGVQTCALPIWDWQREHNSLTVDQYYFGRQMFLLASLIQYTLPGCPSLYYGDEAGLVGYCYLGSIIRSLVNISLYTKLLE